MAIIHDRQGEFVLPQYCRGEDDAHRIAAEWWAAEAEAIA
jgi:hypothetical protein